MLPSHPIGGETLRPSLMDWRGARAGMFRAAPLTKSYGDVTAVDAVDLEVHQGEVFGLLGSNGAGKTTMMKVFMTLLRPDAGGAVVPRVRPGESRPVREAHGAGVPPPARAPPRDPARAGGAADRRRRQPL